MDLPLFVAALEPGAPAPSFEFERASGRLVVRNEGRSHIRFTDFTLQQAGRQLHSVPVFTVLPGSSISLELPQGDRCGDGRGRAGGSGQQCGPDQRRRRAALGAAPRPPSRFRPPSRLTARRRGVQSPEPPQLAAAPAEIAVLTVTFEGKSSPGIAYAVREGSELLLDVDTLARLGIAFDASTTRTRRRPRPRASRRHSRSSLERDRKGTAPRPVVRSEQPAAVEHPVRIRERAASADPRLGRLRQLRRLQHAGARRNPDRGGRQHPRRQHRGVGLRAPRNRHDDRADQREDDGRRHRSADRVPGHELALGRPRQAQDAAGRRCDRGAGLVGPGRPLRRRAVQFQLLAPARLRHLPAAGDRRPGDGPEHHRSPRERHPHRQPERPGRPVQHHQHSDDHRRRRPEPGRARRLRPGARHLAAVLRRAAAAATRPHGVLDQRGRRAPQLRDPELRLRPGIRLRLPAHGTHRRTSPPKRAPSSTATAPPRASEPTCWSASSAW